MDLYSEIILDYFKNPRNKGPLSQTEPAQAKLSQPNLSQPELSQPNLTQTHLAQAPAIKSATEHNPLCGDIITIHLLIEPQTNKIIQATYEGQGCAISQATTSMLTEKLVGLTTAQAANLTKEDIFELIGIEINPGRIKCALIGLTATQTAINLTAESTPK